MNLVIIFVSLLFLVPFGQARTPVPVTTKEACGKFMPAVVRIDVADGRATGFIVSPDGWILTAAHVVIDPSNGERRSAVAILLPDGSSPLATVFVDQESAVRDFALLKVEAKSPLPSIELGSSSEVSPGSDLTIIGYPFSAEGWGGASLDTKFCLSGMVAATDSIANHSVNIDAIYFQGPAVKGISGGPIISRDTGHVVGIQSQKLAGITTALDGVRTKLETGIFPGVHTTMNIDHVSIGPTLIELINVLDRHLANGLGAATAIDDPKRALSKAQRRYKSGK
jgi:S1-C subfamily serine protease